MDDSKVEKINAEEHKNDAIKNMNKSLFEQKIYAVSVPKKRRTVAQHPYISVEPESVGDFDLEILYSQTWGQPELMFPFIAPCVQYEGHLLLK